MLIRTGLGSISMVAGCCWVNSVARPPLARSPRQKAQREELIPPAPGEQNSSDQERGGSNR
jgi:hypothetical protein